MLCTDTMPFLSPLARYRSGEDQQILKNQQFRFLSSLVHPSRHRRGRSGNSAKPRPASAHLRSALAQILMPTTSKLTMAINPMKARNPSTKTLTFEEAAWRLSLHKRAIHGDLEHCESPSISASPIPSSPVAISCLHLGL